MANKAKAWEMIMANLIRPDSPDVHAIARHRIAAENLAIRNRRIVQHCGWEWNVIDGRQQRTQVLLADVPLLLTEMVRYGGLPNPLEVAFSSWAETEESRRYSGVVVLERGDCTIAKDAEEIRVMLYSFRPAMPGSDSRRIYEDFLKELATLLCGLAEPATIPACVR